MTGQRMAPAAESLICQRGQFPPHDGGGAKCAFVSLHCYLTGTRGGDSVHILPE